MDNSDFNYQNPGNPEASDGDLKGERVFNERNAGRRSDEPDMIAKRMLFESLFNGGFSEKEILEEMEISHRTYKRYEESLEQMSFYYDLFNVYPVSVHKFSPINKYSIMADFLKRILDSENSDKLEESWINKAKDRIKYYEKLGSFIDQDSYKLFDSRRFDNIVMGYASYTFDWIIEHHWNGNIKAGAKAVKEVFLRNFLGNMQTGMSPQKAECLYTDKPYMPGQSDGTDSIAETEKHIDEPDENEEDLEEETEEQYELDLSRMKSFKYMYDNGIEPEADSEEYEYYRDYKNWADRLKFVGREMYLPCLSCPGMFQRLDNDRDNFRSSETYVNCDMDCGDAYRECMSEDYGERDRLFEYFLVKKVD